MLAESFSKHITDQKHNIGALVGELITMPELRQQLVNHIAEATRSTYQTYKQSFIDSLSPFNREVYLHSLKIPYAEKDWFRDAHDIVVVWSMSNIVHRESLPDWLITAAIVHDRGYGVLASQPNQSAQLYQQAGGAYWDNADFRVLHSRLSREFAEKLLINPAQLKGFEIGKDGELFLQVVEKHDHPLIEKLDELPRIGRHHLDADMLYSVSLSSFVKDYLALLSDPGKLRQLSEGGLCQPADFTPARLLEIRMSRYFSSQVDLPVGWDIERYPLVPSSVQYDPTKRCIEPYSHTSRQMFHESFKLLAECCNEMISANSVRQFSAWFDRQLAAQFAQLALTIENLKPRLTLNSAHGNNDNLIHLSKAAQF